MVVQHVIIADRDKPDSIEIEINNLLEQGWVIKVRELAMYDDPELGSVIKGMVIFEK